MTRAAYAMIISWSIAALAAFAVIWLLIFLAGI